MDVRQHTENLVDWLSALHFQAPSAEAQSGLERLFALQEEFEAELKRYEERLEEEREREQQEYYKQRQQLEQGDWNIPLVEIRGMFLFAQKPFKNVYINSCKRLLSML